MGGVKVYGADWCGDTQRTREHLDSLGINYDYINIEDDTQAAAWVREQNQGKERKPTVKIGERVLSVPDNTELEGALGAEGMIKEKG
ncbi:MAG TPA: glutaredoxin family protein [Pyrinomonadaceae bacterium]|jgi:glutaredoxin